jgi:OFA family oxalate/formate antiporter-like MFS transporter
MSSSVKNKGWLVTFSGTGINLALGILYTWSIFKGAIESTIKAGGEGAFNWDLASTNTPYSVCCIVFAFVMILAGKCQDKFGPRLTAFIGGVLVSIGLIWISTTTSFAVWVMGFGLLTGAGIGFGYSAATPPALKWFPPSRTGLIAGLVVAGFGLASVYIAPLSQYLLGIWGIHKSMLFFGIAFLIAVCGLSTMLVNPPADYKPEENNVAGAVKQPAKPQDDTPPSGMMKSGKFYIIWLIYFIGAGAGLMVISSVAGMAKKSLGDMAFLAVAIMAIGNAGGRIIAGVLSDKIGRRLTLTLMLLFQCVLMLIAIPIVGKSSSAVILVLLATFIGFNYGTNLSLFPSLTKDNWGLKNFGINYGIVFTAWGIGGFVMPILSQMLYAKYNVYTYSFLTAAVFLFIGVLLTFALKVEKRIIKSA